MSNARSHPGRAGGSPKGISQSDEWKTAASKKLSALYDRFPIWLTLAVKVLEQDQDLSKLPDKAANLADKYLQEVYQQDGGEPAQVEAVVRWVALLRIVNREDEETLQLLAEATKIGQRTSLLVCLDRLMKRRLIVQRGARNRLIEIKPDVVRDRVLVTWLTVNVGFGKQSYQPTEYATALSEAVFNAIKQGTINTFHRSVLVALARTQWLLQSADHPLFLVDSFVDRLIDAIGQLSAAKRIAAVRVVAGVAEVLPAKIANIAKILRESSCAPESIKGLFGERLVNQDSVILELAWVLFSASTGARTTEEKYAVLRELCELLEAEFVVADRLPHGLPKDGKRAEAIIVRILEGGPEFWGDYEEEAKQLGLQLLEDANTATLLSSKRKKLVEVLIGACIATERHRTHFDQFTAVVEMITIIPGTRSWETRNALVDKMKELLEISSLNLSWKEALWAIFAKAHNDGVIASGRISDPAKSVLRKELLSDLRWAHTILSSRTPNASITELTVARKLWNWHLRFNSDKNFKAAAQDLESLYLENNLSRLFAPLSNYDDWEKRLEKIDEIAEQLANTNQHSAIVKFLEDAIQFFGESAVLDFLAAVSFKLGFLALKTSSVQEYVRISLQEPTETKQYQFGSLIARNWARALRQEKQSDEALTLVKELTALHKNTGDQVTLLSQIYIASTPSQLGPMSGAEQDFLRSAAPSFLENGRIPMFLLIFGWSFKFDWVGYQRTACYVLDAVPLDRMLQCVQKLIESVYKGVRESQDATQDLTVELCRWLLDQCLRLPDIDALGHTTHWYIEDIFKRSGVLLPLEWMLLAFRRREELAKKANNNSVVVIPTQSRLSRYVQPVTSDNMANEEIKQAIGDLLEYVGDTGFIGYYLRDYLHDLDPKGLILPDIVAQRLITTDTFVLDDLYRWARLSSVYSVNSPSWRKISIPICKKTTTMNEKERNTLFSGISESGPRSWSSNPGEVPEIFVADRDYAERSLRDETDPILLTYWKWRYQCAEAELQEQEELAKERRGE